LHFIKDPWNDAGDPEAKYNTERWPSDAKLHVPSPLIGNVRANRGGSTALTTYILPRVPRKFLTLLRAGPTEKKFSDMHFNSHKEAGKWVFDHYAARAVTA